MAKKNYLWGVLYGVALTSFTVYIALDTFVIPRVYTTVPQSSTLITSESSSSAEVSTAEGIEQSDSDSSENTAATENASVTTNSYSDENISIQITTYREYDTNIYVADVTLTSADFLKTALAQSAYGKNITEKTSVIASSVNAILAINGDFYGAQETGYVIRNGVLYRSDAAEDQEDLVVYRDGTFGIISESDVTAQELIDSGALQVLSFGPALITDSSISVSESTEVGKAMSSNPRTAIAVVDDLHYLFVVSDGRTSESEGLTLYQMATFLEFLGATTAYNLDGGGSSTMYFNGEVINQPTTNGDTIKERSVSDIVYIGAE